MAAGAGIPSSISATRYIHIIFIFIFIFIFSIAHEVGPDGVPMPCCDSPEHTISKLIEIFMEFLAILYDQESREDRWFQMISAIKPYAFGARCHGFLLAALRLMCPLTAEDTAEALRDSEDDDSKVFFSKRLKRGV